LGSYGHQPHSGQLHGRCSFTHGLFTGGQAMPGRTWIGGDEYRYTNNGHEREDEIFENAQSAEHWMFDSRILRRWEIDPMTYEWQSPYACFDNNPIALADMSGEFGDPPDTIAAITKTKPVPQIPNYLKLKLEGMEKGFGNMAKPNLWARAFGTAAYVLMPADHKAPWPGGEMEETHFTKNRLKE
jgi:hypothetical protein